MYSYGKGLIFGFHGCDIKTAKKVINLHEPLKRSENDYDWLGNGMYFWENSPARALEFAKNLVQKGKVNQPCVLGAVIQLGNCLDFLDYEKIGILKFGYDILSNSLEKQQKPIPQNKKVGDSNDFLLRQLDCAVIEGIHSYRSEYNFKPFDSVRGVFWEGKEIYPTAGFREKDHIQICIRNPNCIKGFFYSIENDNKFEIV